MSATILLTGATSGIGHATACALAAAGHHLIMAVRDTRRGHALRHDLARQHNNAQIDVIECDLANRTSVDACADKVARRYPVLDVLINNAGSMQREAHLAESGFELTFAANHLGPFQLTNRLLPCLQAAPLGRVVTVTSAWHAYGVLDFEHLRSLKHYRMLRAYNRSKLANVAFSLALARRLGDSNVRANCLHPGVVGTNILPGDTPLWRAANRMARAVGVYATPAQGAATTLYLALAAPAADMQGLYLDAHQIPQVCAATARDLSAQERLWALSADATGTG